MPQEQIKLLAMTIEAVRCDVNRQLDDLAAQVSRLLPEDEPAEPVEDWKAEVSTW